MDSRDSPADQKLWGVTFGSGYRADPQEDAFLTAGYSSRLVIISLIGVSRTLE